MALSFRRETRYKITGKGNLVYYLRYPEPFAEKIGVAKTISVELAAVRKEIVLGGPTKK